MYRVCFEGYLRVLFRLVGFPHLIPLMRMDRTTSGVCLKAPLLVLLSYLILSAISWGEDMGPTASSRPPPGGTPAERNCPRKILKSVRKTV